MHRAARRDARLGARVVGRRSLAYTEGADASVDRPAHVRAASSLVHFRGALAVAQDDASFLALVTPNEVRAFALPSPTGVRQFDDGRGNKKDKLDLEAIAVVRSAGRDVLLAFGSGSAAKREVIVTFDEALVVHDASAFYGALPAEFRGSELNLEGVVTLGSNLLLVQRGNGAPHGDLRPVDATALVSASALLEWLAGRGDAPNVHSIATWDLGAIEGCRLTFTDATSVEDFGAKRRSPTSSSAAPPRRGNKDSVLFSAAAEDSPDALSDGVVTGVAIGVLDEDPRWAPVMDESGEPLKDKIEGLAPAAANRLWAVVDVDDPAKPSELLEIDLTGPWL